MNSPGFFLIQSLVYCVVLAFCCALLFTYAARTNISLSHINGYAHDYGMLLAAHDVCVRDIQAGTADASKWHEAGDDLLVWRVGDEDRGWWSKLITIERVVGRFDHKKKKWIKSTKGLVAQIDEADISIDHVKDAKKKKILKVELSVSGKSKKHEIAIQSTIAPRNRVV